MTPSASYFGPVGTQSLVSAPKGLPLSGVSGPPPGVVFVCPPVWGPGSCRRPCGPLPDSGFLRDLGHSALGEQAPVCGCVSHAQLRGSSISCPLCTSPSKCCLLLSPGPSAFPPVANSQPLPKGLVRFRDLLKVTDS